MCPQLSTLVTIEYGGRIDTREEHHMEMGQLCQFMWLILPGISRLLNFDDKRLDDESYLRHNEERSMT